MSPEIYTNRNERFDKTKEAMMRGHSPYVRFLAAIGTVALVALGSSASSFAGARIHQPPKTLAILGHPVVKDAGGMQLVSLGYGCGDLETFVIVKNGQRSVPMC